MNESDKQEVPIEDVTELTLEELDGVAGGVIGLADDGIAYYECPGCGATIEAIGLASLKQLINEHNLVCPGPPFAIL